MPNAGGAKAQVGGSSSSSSSSAAAGDDTTATFNFLPPAAAAPIEADDGFVIGNKNLNKLDDSTMQTPEPDRRRGGRDVVKAGQASHAKAV